MILPTIPRKILLQFNRQLVLMGHTKNAPDDLIESKIQFPSCSNRTFQTDSNGKKYSKTGGEVTII